MQSIYEEVIKRKDSEIEELKKKNKVILATVMDQQNKISELNDILRRLKNIH